MENRPLIIDAYQGNKTETIPVWLMRQAGRYLPEYRALREKAGGFLDLCYNPEWAAEVTLQPLRRYDLDAAILFSDILVIPQAMGQDLTFQKGEGPVLGPLDLDQLNDSQDQIENFLSPVFETVSRVRAQLSPSQALIGFCGAPWTVACYMIDGRGKTGFPKANKMALEDPDRLQIIIDKIVTASIHYLRAQIDAGAQAIQIFDSWAGYLSGGVFDQFCARPVAKIVHAVRQSHPDIPIIGFPRAMLGNMADYIAQTGVNVLALGTDADRQQARHLDICLQGNLDPDLLLQGGEAMKKAVKQIMFDLDSGPFVFNLGHGVIKETNPDHISQLIETIKQGA